MNIMKKKYIWLTVLLCIITSVASFYLAYHFNTEQDKKTAVPESAIKNTARIASEIAAFAAAINNHNKITGSTKIVYQYFYEEDGQLEEFAEEPPYFLIGMPKDDLQKYFPDWQIVSFSPVQVTMRKSVAGKSMQRYIVSSYEGYVAVFYEEGIGGDGLRELTDTPVSSLSAEERERLDKGISVVGDDSLIKVLEDYGS